MTPECDACVDYLERRRTVLLPHIGTWVTRFGKRPAIVVERLTDAFHRRHG